jgi:hypothetical protein
MRNKLIALSVIAVLIIGVGLFAYNISIKNHVARLSNLFDAQIQVVEGFHDKMWKTISEKCKIVDKQKDAFKEIYIPLIQGRYSQDNGKMMMWIKEQNPAYDQSTFKDLMVAVESLRAGFFEKQKMVIATVQEFKDIRDQWPSSIFCPVSERTKLMEAFKPITSTRSKEVMEAGKDDETYIK